MNNFDGIDFAEKLTGKSYKTDDTTALLGLAFHMENCKRVKEELQAASDSYYGITILDFLELAKIEGFEIIHCKHFETCYDRTEQYYSLWSTEGILLTVESYGDKINTAKMYYNLNVGDYQQFDFISSGSFDKFNNDRVWVGNHDVREGFRKSLKLIRKVNPMSVWIKQPFLWLLTYMDTKQPYDYKVLNADMIAQYPTKVQSAIAGVI